MVDHLNLSPHALESGDEAWQDAQAHRSPVCLRERRPGKTLKLINLRTSPGSMNRCLCECDENGASRRAARVTTELWASRLRRREARRASRGRWGHATWGHATTAMGSNHHLYGVARGTCGKQARAAEAGPETAPRRSSSRLNQRDTQHLSPR